MFKGFYRINLFFQKKVVFFLLISKIIPPTSIVVPLISKYLLFTFIMNILSVLNTCIVIGFYFKELKLNLMPPWFRYLFLKLLPTILFIRRKKTMDKFYAKKELTNILNEIKYDPPSPIVPLVYSSEMPNEFAAGVKKRYNTEYVSAFSSPTIRSSTVNRFPPTNPSDQYDATLTTKPKAKGYEHILNRKSNSQHDMVLTQDGGNQTASAARRVVTSAIRQAILNNPGHYDDNDAIIKSYLKEKLTQKKKKKILNIPKNTLYDVEKLNRSPEVRKRFQQQASGSKKVQIGNGLHAGLNPNLNLNSDYGNLAFNANKRTSTPRGEFAGSMSGAHSVEAGLHKKAAATGGQEQQQQPRKRRVIGFETFQFSERFAKLVRSVDYIASIYKAKAEIDDVRIWKFVLDFEILKVKIFRF